VSTASPCIRQLHSNTKLGAWCTCKLQHTSAWKRLRTSGANWQPLVQIENQLCKLRTTGANWQLLVQIENQLCKLRTTGANWQLLVQTENHQWKLLLIHVDTTNNAVEYSCFVSVTSWVRKSFRSSAKQTEWGVRSFPS